MRRRAQGLRGGINVPNTPGNLLKEVNGKDTTKILQSTFLYQAALIAMIFALVGALYVTLTTTVTKNIAMIFLWVLFAILALGLITIWFNVQNFQLVLGTDSDDQVILKNRIESSCRSPRGGSSVISASTSVVPTSSVQAMPSTSAPSNAAMDRLDILTGVSK